MFLNRDRFEQTLARSGFDALIATTPQNVQYAAGYVSERLHNFVALQSYVLMPRAVEEFCLILPSTEMVHLASKRTAVAALRRYGAFFVMAEQNARLTAEEGRLLDLLDQVPGVASPVDALGDAVERAGLASARLGLDEDNMPWPILARLRERLPTATFEPAASWFRFIRMVKTEREIGVLKRVAAINESGLTAAISACQAGIGEDVAHARFREEVTRAGATPRLWGTSSGANSSCFFWPGARMLELGDLVRIDCGCTIEGYWSDTGETVAVGEPRPAQRRAYEAIRVAIEAGIEAARAGTAVTVIGDRVLEVAHREGLTDLQRHHCGHGIGLELYEPPMLVRSGGRSDIFAGGFEDTLLEPGMVINIEAPYYRLGFGGLHLEHTVLVRSSGPELLSDARHLRLG